METREQIVKLTKSKLQQIIAEELKNFKEATGDDPFSGFEQEFQATQNQAKTDKLLKDARVNLMKMALTMGHPESIKLVAQAIGNKSRDLRASLKFTLMPSNMKAIVAKEGGERIYGAWNKLIEVLVSQLTAKGVFKKMNEASKKLSSQNRFDFQKAKNLKEYAIAVKPEDQIQGVEEWIRTSKKFLEDLVAAQIITNNISAFADSNIWQPFSKILQKHKNAPSSTTGTSGTLSKIQEKK